MVGCCIMRSGCLDVGSLYATGVGDPSGWGSIYEIQCFRAVGRRFGVGVTDDWGTKKKASKRRFWTPYVVGQMPLQLLSVFHLPPNLEVAFTIGR